MSEPTRQTVEVYPQRAGKTSRQREHLRSRPERWRVDVAAPVKQWVPHALFNSRESAEAYAQERRDEDQSTLTDWRVVDMQPDVEDRRAPIVDHSCDDQARETINVHQSTLPRPDPQPMEKRPE